MKTKIKFLVYPLAVIFVSLFIIAGCSDDDAEPINPPTVTTLSVTDITETSAKSGGNITDDGGGEITARGVVWNTEANPTLENYSGATVDGTGSGVFQSNITSLAAGTTYFVRAYATNSAGTSYGNDVMFETEADEDDDNGDDDIIYGDGVTDIDGNEYVTVIIGDQEWMAENLRVTKYNNGDAIPAGLSNAEWENTTEGAYAIYYNDDDMSQAYGKLYNWYAVDDSRGLCPDGWSVPSDDDWTVLVDYVVSHGYSNNSTNPNGAGNALKACRQVGHPNGGHCDTSEHPRWNSNNTHSGFDEYGFSALPGGQRWWDGGYIDVGLFGCWWSASERIGISAWGRKMSSFSGHKSRNYFMKTFGFSLRCVRDFVPTEDE